MSKTKTPYWQLLQDPQWQKKRLEVLNNHQWSCDTCGSGVKDGKQLHVHHRYYTKGRMPWLYPDWSYEVQCDECHEEKHEDPSSLQDWEKEADSFFFYGHEFYTSDLHTMISEFVSKAHPHEWHKDHRISHGDCLIVMHRALWEFWFRLNDEPPEFLRKVFVPTHIEERIVERARRTE